MDWNTAVPVSQGGMGRVLRAFDAQRGTDVAIKVLLHEDPQWVERMMREAAAQARLSHPNICPVYDFGERDGQHFIAMQFIDGDRLDRACAGLPVETIVRIMIDVVDAVLLAHREGLVHRDLKPGNILVEARPDGKLHPYVLDFGLVRHVGDQTLTATGELLGTPGYMSPEQARATERVDRRSDLFSIGVMLYELVTGKLPFTGGSPTQLLLDIASGRVQPIEKTRPDLPAALVRIIHQCLESSPALRYQDAGSLKADLEAYLAGESVSARRVGFLHRLNRRVRRHPVAAGLLVLAVMVTMTAVALGIRSAVSAEERARLAAYYSRQSEKLESDLRLAWLKPPHDLTSEIATARQSAAELEAALLSLSDTERSLAGFAAGKAYLLVGDLAKAIALLKPLVANDAQNADAAAMLGVAYGRQFAAAVANVMQTADASIRTRRVADLSARFAEQAGPLLDESSGMKAYFDGDYVGATALLEQQLMREAWPVDSLLTLADIHLASAADFAGLARYGPAREQLARAESRILEAAQIARSYPPVFAAVCRLANANLFLERDSGAAGANQSLPNFVTLCARGMVLLPEEARPLVDLAQVLSNRAARSQRNGEDPSEDLQRCKALAMQALQISPELTKAQLVLAQSWSVEGSAVSNAGGDALPLWLEAIDAAQPVAEREPGNADVWMTLAGLRARAASMLVTRQGQFEQAQAMYIGAADAYRTVSALPDAPAAVQSSLGYVLADHAYQRYSRGLPADELLEEALMLTRAAAAAQPDYAGGLARLGYAAWTYAEYLGMQGLDLTDLVLIADDAYSRARQISPNRTSLIINQQGPLALLAAQRLDAGIDATDIVERLEGLQRELQDRTNGEVEIPVNDVMNATLRGRQAAQRGDAPEPHFKKARDSLKRSAAFEIDAVANLGALARLAVAEVTVSTSLNWPQVQADLDQLSAGLAEFEDLAEVRAMRGRLAAIASAKTANSQLAQQLHVEAMQDLSRALDDNALLENRFRPDLTSLDGRLP